MMEQEKETLFIHYQPAHRERLRALVKTSEWRKLLAREDALRQWKEDVRVPPPTPGQQAMANQYLRERNAERVQKLLHEGVRDKKVLLEVLGNWETALAGDDRFPIVFLGLVLTLDCCFLPRCLYCNQLWLPRRLTLDDWKTLLSEAAEPIPPYVYLTGGEPLILGAEVWGDEGLVAFATKLDGLFNVQIAREVLGVNHPQIHINCVMTARNFFQFPDLLRFLLEIRQVRSPSFEGSIKDDPVFRDFAFHLIPVGGSENAFLRPTDEEWKRFYSETWTEAEQVWQDYQADIGIPEDERIPLYWFAPFGSPYLRVQHRMSLDEYCEMAARGNYWQDALTERCYVAPTQAFVLPDSSQHWCGAHAIRRPRPLGNVQENTLRENIRANIGQLLTEYPNAFCTSCAGATCAINQAAERNLRNQIVEWLQEHDSKKINQ